MMQGKQGLKAKIDVEKPIGDGRKLEVSQKVDPEKAKKMIKAKGAKSPRSVFAKGKGQRPNAMKAGAMNISVSPDEKQVPKSAFSNMGQGMM